MREFINRLTSNRVLLTKLLLASFLVNLLALATPVYVIQVLQRYVAYGVTSTLITLVIGVSLISVFEFFFRNIRHRMAREYELGNIILTNRVLNKLASIKSHIYETSSKFRNDIINKNLSIIQAVYSATGFLVILDVPFSIIFLIAIFLIHYQLGFIALIFLTIPFLINYFYKERIGSLSKRSDGLSSSSFRVFDNVITRNITIKFFDLMKPLSATWNLIANKIASNREDLESEKNILNSFSSGTSSFLTIAIIAWGATLAVDGQISVGALIGANILAARALMPLIKYTQMQESIGKGQHANSEIRNFLQVSSDINQGRELKNLNGEISFINVQFIYPSLKNPIFENLNFTAKPGDLVVLTGINGSGKSTLIKIIAGILEINKGQIFVDRIDLSQLSPTWYREQLIYSPQEPKFIDGSLAENIFGSNRINGQEMNKILENSDLLTFVNGHEQGINMKLENRGNELALGIRKRISIARSLVNNGRVVLYDEPTEGLDQTGKASILKLVNKFKKDQKTIIIASNDNEIIEISNILIDMNSKPTPNIKGT